MSKLNGVMALSGYVVTFNSISFGRNPLWLQTAWRKMKSKISHSITSSSSHVRSIAMSDSRPASITTTS